MTFTKSLFYKSKDYWRSYRANNKYTHLALSAICFIIYLWFAILIFIADFITDFIKIVKHSPITEEEMLERARLKKLAREAAAISYGRKHGVQTYIDKRKAKQAYDRLEWWEK